MNKRTNSPHISKTEVDAVLYQRKAMLPATELQQRILNTYRLTDEYRRSYGEYLFTQNADRESIKNAIKSIKHHKHISSVDVAEFRDMIIDMLYSKYVLGFKFYEYFLYDFEHTPIHDRFCFLSSNLQKRYYSKLNNSKEHNAILDNKFLAYELLRPWYGRDVVSIDKSNFDVFAGFVKVHPKFIMKPSGNYGGHGVSLIEYDGSTDLRHLYDLLIEKSDKFICEELVIAPEYMKRLYPHSINTVRMLTYYNGTDAPIVLAALLRVGQNGSVVDNFSSGGIIAAIDINTGVINSGGVDLSNRRYTVHPDSGVPFEGFQIEKWDELMSLVKQTPRLLPQVRLIGWDLAASADKGWQIIEANAHPWIEIHQFCHPKGFRQMIEEATEWKKHGI